MISDSGGSIPSASAGCPSVTRFIQGICTGAMPRAPVLLSWGALVVGQVDAVVRPAVVGAHVKTYPLLVFFALFGGVKVFGIIGIFAGPAICLLG